MVPLIVKLTALACAVSAAAVSDLHPLSEEAITLINSKQSTWKAGRNFPQNTPIKHLKNRLGLLQSTKNILPTITHSDKLKASLPENFDARQKWPNCPTIREIRDQGSCGNCWAVASAAAMSDRVCIYSNGKRNLHISAEDLTNCASGEGLDGCDGGIPEVAFYYWADHGLVSGGNYNSKQGCQPYSTPPCVHHAPNETVNTKQLVCLDSYVDTPRCVKTCEAGYAKKYEDDKIYGKQGYLINRNEEDIKAEIFTNGPVVVSFEVATDFFNYRSGVYKHLAGEYLGGHAVKALGWGVEDGTKYWLIANSWNTNWGDKGFFKILRGQDESNIESYYAAAGEPLLDE